MHSKVSPCFPILIIQHHKSRSIVRNTKSHFNDTIIHTFTPYCISQEDMWMTSGSQGLINQIRDNITQRKSEKKMWTFVCTTRCPAYSYNSPKKIFATSVMFPQLSHLKIFSGSCSIIKQYETKKRLPPSKEIDKYRTEKKTEKKKQCMQPNSSCLSSGKKEFATIS